MLAHYSIRYQVKPEEQSNLQWFWILPGGLTFQVINGQLALYGPAQGFREPSTHGDPMPSSDGKLIMPYQESSPGMPTTYYSGKFGTHPYQQQTGTWLGLYGGFAGEFTSVQIESMRETLPGFVFPNITFSYPNGLTNEEKYGVWGLDQLYPIAGSYQEGWQNWYSKGMAYRQGMISSRLVSYMFGARSEGGPYVGSCHDGQTHRLIPHPTTAQLRQLGEAAGIFPDDDEAIPGTDPHAFDSFNFDLVKPIGVVDGERVMVTGVIHYTGKVVRMPKASERAWYMRGRPGYDAQNYRWSHPLLDAPIQWFWGTTPALYKDRGPIHFEESVSAFIYFTGIVGRLGFEELTPTGVAKSYSTVAKVHSDFTRTDSVSFTIFKRVSDGGYEVYWRGAPNIPTYYGTVTPYTYVTPNGWKIPVMLPVISTSPIVRDTRYYMIAAFARSPTYSATPPTKPTGAPADWAPPPFDPPPDIWRGQLFRDTRDGSDAYAPGLNNTNYPYHVQGGITVAHGLDPNGEYHRKQGEIQRFGTGQFAVSIWGAKSVSTIKAPVGNKVAVISDPGGDPVTRFFEGPSGVAMAKTQNGGWRIRQGGIWYSSTVDFGEVGGTLQTLHAFEPPDPPPQV